MALPVELMCMIQKYRTYLTWTENIAVVHRQLYQLRLYVSGTDYQVGWPRKLHHRFRRYIDLESTALNWGHLPSDHYFVDYQIYNISCDRLHPVLVYYKNAYYRLDCADPPVLTCSGAGEPEVVMVTL